MQSFIAIVVSMLLTLGAMAFGAHSEKVMPTPSVPAPHDSTTPLATQKEGPNVPLYKVVKVIDGDTVTIHKGGETVTLRLIGLDAPESTTLRKGVIECFGDEATERARELLSGTSVSIETDSSQDTYDKYGRLLVFVFLPDGTNFNQRMIEEGYGHEYTYSAPYKYQKEFRTAERRAQAAQRGLWNPSACSDAQSQKAAPAQSAGAATPLDSYDCSKNTYNCSSFKTQSEAQSAFEACGGARNDIHKLDSDSDGQVCEGLP